MNSRTITTSHLKQFGASFGPSDVQLQIKCVAPSYSAPHVNETFFVDIINRGEQFTVFFKGVSGSSKYLTGNMNVKGFNRDSALQLIHENKSFRWANYEALDLVVAELIYRAVYALRIEYRDQVIVDPFAIPAADVTSNDEVEMVDIGENEGWPED